MQTNKENKQRLILISDLWGKENSEWVVYYRSILSQYFEVIYYDSCDLGNIDKSEYTEEKLHHQFLNGGIDRAVENILKNEKELIDVLGFSVGGYIAWKACLAGLNIQNLYAISSTRLRYETQKPSTNIKLFYGKNDNYKPDSDWFKKMEIKTFLLPNQTHELYKEKVIAEEICKVISE